MQKSKFIVIYGINNLGKTTQAKLLVQKLNSFQSPDLSSRLSPSPGERSNTRKAEYLKYPVYDLEPSGPALNEYLRQGNPEKLDAKQAQILFAQNRAQYEPTLKAKLENGIDIVAEDYWGTGVAWGVGAGVDKDFLLELNSKFFREDLALLFVGERFGSGIEGNHLHEADDELTRRVEQAHNELGKEFGWKIIDANGSIEKVQERVWSEVSGIL